MIKKNAKALGARDGEAGIQGAPPPGLSPRQRSEYVDAYNAGRRRRSVRLAAIEARRRLRASRE